MQDKDFAELQCSGFLPFAPRDCLEWIPSWKKAPTIWASWKKVKGFNGFIVIFWVFGWTFCVFDNQSFWGKLAITYFYTLDSDARDCHYLPLTGADLWLSVPFVPIQVLWWLGMIETKCCTLMTRYDRNKMLICLQLCDLSKMQVDTQVLRKLFEFALRH